MDAVELAGIIRDQVAREVGVHIDALRIAFEHSVKSIPPGQDGRHGLDGKDGRDGLHGKDGAVGPQGERGDKGERGEPGIQGEPGERGVVGEAGAKGEKGDQGLTGKDGAPGIAGKDGAPGKDGQKGADGVNGRDGVEGAAGKDGAPGPEGQKGADGLHGKDGAPGPEGQKGVDGRDGKDGAPGPEGQKGMDGKSVTLDEIRPIFEGEVAKWALDFERRASDVLEKAIDRIPAPRDGKDGRDGVDGMNFEDVEVEAKDGGRVTVWKFKAGEREVVREIKTDAIIDRGVYRPGYGYEKGDCITYAGALWIAQNDISKPPGDQDPGWRLAVKRGRDGKDA